MEEEYYNNIEEIERDIEILKLKTEIQEEKIKLRIQHLKADLAPKTLFQDLLLETTKGISALGIIRRLIRKRR